ncbi:hypothetical protein DSTSK_17260 [Desulforhabdus sp. TSK]|nr:hypothetical protein DSTSK_17260 [Desulforhabdus sp. TSK]
MTSVASGILQIHFKKLGNDFLYIDIDQIRHLIRFGEKPFSHAMIQDHRLWRIKGQADHIRIQEIAQKNSFHTSSDFRFDFPLSTHF